MGSGDWQKVITTNKDIVKMPFYNSAQIKIVDRDNPILDVDFVKRRKVFCSATVNREITYRQMDKLLVITLG